VSFLGDSYRIMENAKGKMPARKTQTLELVKRSEADTAVVIVVAAAAALVDNINIDIDVNID